MNIVLEIKILIASFKDIKIKKVAKEKMIFEFVSNAIAALFAIGVYNFAQSLFIVDSNLKYNLKKTFASRRIQDNEISQEEFEWWSTWIIDPSIFILSIVVFSIVEQVLQNYYDKRKLM